MPSHIDRRSFIATVPSLLVIPAMLSNDTARAYQDPIYDKPVSEVFPGQSRERVREMVGASHGNLARVTELLEESPALAKATWDWGFGDWETALGAASHVGSVEIAKLLMKHGARPDIFTFAMLGQLEVVKAYVAANPGIQRTHGPHGITLMQHAKKGAEPALSVVKYLEKLGDADIPQTSAELAENEARGYLGDYIGTNGSEVRIRISLNKEGRLNIMRLPDGANRLLFYVGNNEFYPTGATAVRIRFAVAEGKTTNVTIIDGKPIFTAQRVA